MSEIQSQLGQLLQISLPQNELQKWNKILEEIVPGSIVIQGANVSNSEDVRNFVKTVDEICDELSVQQKYRPLIGITHEGGWISRIEDIENSPGNMALAATGSTELTYSSYRAMGQELSSLGIDWNLAPTVDLNTTAKNPIIGVRSFGDDPDGVSLHAAAAVNGLEEAGLLACLKHFPGHGESERDSHLELPVILKSREDIVNSDLVPYRSLIKRGIDSVMISHIYYPKLEDKQEPLPASLSSNVVNGLLRGDMGYEGLVITDSLSMEAVASNFDMDYVAVTSINAGVDILECAKAEYYLELFHGLQDGVATGKVSGKRINESLQRFADLKETSKNRKKVAKHWSREVLSKVTSFSALRSITSLHEGNLKSESTMANGTLSSVFFTRKRMLEEVAAHNQNSPVEKIFKGWGKDTKLNLVLPRNVTEENISENVDLIGESIKRDDLIVIFLNDSTAYSSQNPGKSPQLQFVNKLYSRIGNRMAVIGTGTPYESGLIPRDVRYISAYSFAEPSLMAAVGVLIGAIPPEGKVPVKI